MKTNAPDPLDELLLSSWEVTAEAPRSFRREVWQRVSATEAEEPGWLARFAWWLLRPARETLVVAAVVIVAVVWGVTHPPAARLTPHEAYVQSISPFDPHHSGTRQP